jgi:hypothetical protein
MFFPYILSQLFKQFEIYRETLPVQIYYVFLRTLSNVSDSKSLQLM